MKDENSGAGYTQVADQGEVETNVTYALADYPLSSTQQSQMVSSDLQ